MLGYTLPNSDLYIFFENDEIERLRKEKIQGTYFNLKDDSVIGLLEASINDSIRDITTSANKNGAGLIEWLHLELRSKDYLKLNERGAVGQHDGFRHIELLDSKRLRSSDQTAYNQMKYYESCRSQKKT